MRTPRQIPEQDIPDNGPQQQAFEALVEHRREPRVYLIRDARPGCGKTLLLRKLLWACRTRRNAPPQILAAAVDLQDYTDANPYPLIKALAQELGTQHLPSFDQLQLELEMRRPDPFLGRNLAAGVDIRGATLRDQAQVAAIIANAGAHIHVPERALPQWNEDLRPRAERAIVSAFFDDLRALAPGLLVAIFIDSVDGKPEARGLVRWVRETLLEKIFLSVHQRPKNAILCVAGRDLPDYAKQLPDQFEQLVEAPQLLTAWQREDTDAFLRIMLGRPITATMVELVHAMIVGEAVPLKRAYEGALAFSPAPSDE